MNIKFISYTGKYPNLCSGVLTVEIDGKEYKFGHESTDYDFEKRCYINDNFEQFWISSGSINMSYSESDDVDCEVTKGPWEITGYCDEADEKHPQWVIDILPELLKVFNENVPHGCCGGCI
jgi:hypothetical protein